MEKYKLLKQIGFSDEYISRLIEYENEQVPVYDAVAEDDIPLSADSTNIIVSESTHNYSDRLAIHKK